MLKNKNKLIACVLMAFGVLRPANGSYDFFPNPSDVAAELAADWSEPDERPWGPDGEDDDLFQSDFLSSDLDIRDELAADWSEPDVRPLGSASGIGIGDDSNVRAELNADWRESDESPWGPEGGINDFLPNDLWSSDSEAAAEEVNQSEPHRRPWTPEKKIDLFPPEDPGDTAAGIEVEKKEEDAREEAALQRKILHNRLENVIEQRVGVWPVPYENNIPEIKALLRTGAELTTINVFNQTLLHIVGRPAICEWLLDHGLLPFIDHWDDYGRTPLHSAVAYVHRMLCDCDIRDLQRVDSILVLLKYGANPLALNALGQTARQMVEILVETLETRDDVYRMAGGHRLSVMLTKLKEMVPVLQKAEEVRLVAHPNARVEAIDVLRARPAEQRARLAFAESRWVKLVIELGLERLEKTLAAMDAAEELRRKGWIARAKNSCGNFFKKVLTKVGLIKNEPKDVRRLFD